MVERPDSFENWCVFRWIGGGMFGGEIGRWPGGGRLRTGAGAGGGGGGGNELLGKPWSGFVLKIFQISLIDTLIKIRRIVTLVVLK